MKRATSNHSVTEALRNWHNVDEAQLDEVLPLIYGELRRLAGYYMNREEASHTLQPTALVHEAYLRLAEQKHVSWENRAHFLGVAAEMMRRILVNYALHKQTIKRGGALAQVSLSVADNSFQAPDANILALDEALGRLAAFDERKGRIVELKFFGGLTTNEIASLLQLSVATIEREWSLARAWLYRELVGEAMAS